MTVLQLITLETISKDNAIYKNARIKFKKNVKIVNHFKDEAKKN